MNEVREEESVEVKVVDENDEKSNKMNFKRSAAAKIRRMPDGVFNGFCILVASVILIITYAASPRWNIVSFTHIY